MCVCTQQLSIVSRWFFFSNGDENFEDCGALFFLHPLKTIRAHAHAHLFPHWLWWIKIALKPVPNSITRTSAIGGAIVSLVSVYPVETLRIRKKKKKNWTFLALYLWILVFVRFPHLLDFRWRTDWTGGCHPVHLQSHTSCVCAIVLPRGRSTWWNCIVLQRHRHDGRLGIYSSYYSFWASLWPDPLTIAAAAAAAVTHLKKMTVSPL